MGELPGISAKIGVAGKARVRLRDRARAANVEDGALAIASRPHFVNWFNASGRLSA